LPILCQRFTTSKLKDFDDLMKMTTYGFRGEALASISHIAHLRITTKTMESSCAYRAHFQAGKLIPGKPGDSAEPKPCAGRQGTQITVEDLFYNIPNRKKAFRSPSEEYAKILDVVGRCAVHCEGVAFSCKKAEESRMSISVGRDASTIDRIRQIHNSALASELLPFKVHDPKLGFTASGYASNTNYHAKKTTILLFVNHRAVESSGFKAAVTRAYSVFLPKGGHPFVYLDLEIKPDRVDVNVHPTKREVSLLNEDEIIEVVTDCLRDELAKVDTSRTFMTQSVLPTAKIADVLPSRTPKSTSTGPKLTPRPAENNLVRTDPTLRKITSMLGTGDNTNPSKEPKYAIVDRPHMQIRLTSIKELRASVRETMHNRLTDIFASHTFVGIVDTLKRVVAIQSGVKLFLVDYGMVSNEFFYQVALTDFGNFGTFAFETPLDIHDLVQIAAEMESGKTGADLSKVPVMVTDQLVARREMLLEYFNVHIAEDGKLLALPLLLKGYMPSLAKLPRFLMRLGPCVDWNDEKKCFTNFAVELASFYTPQKVPNPPTPKRNRAENLDAENGSAEAPPEDSEIVEGRDQLSRMLEHVLFPAFKLRLVGTKGLLRAVVEVADLKGLYRVFERC